MIKIIIGTYLLIKHILIIQFYRVHFFDHVLFEVKVDVHEMTVEFAEGCLHIHRKNSRHFHSLLVNFIKIVHRVVNVFFSSRASIFQ